MRRNPLLYSEPSDIEQTPSPTHTPASPEKKSKSSVLFYFIILANSLLVLFVLGFIWFLFFKSPDIQIKDLSQRLFGMSTSTQQPVQRPAPEITSTEDTKVPTQQEKDEIQQTKLKQMREEQEALAAERARLETIKNELQQERLRASEAQQAINDLKEQKKAEASAQLTASDESEQIESNEARTEEAAQTPPAQAEQASPPEPSTSVTSENKAPDIVPNAAAEPNTNTTDSQVDLIIEALRNQQQENAENN